MDQQLLDWIVAHRTAWLDHVAFALKDIGQSPVSDVAVVLGTLIATVRRRQWAWGLGMCLAAVGALVVSALGKAIVARPRPPLEDALLKAHGWSMPSSVALLCAALGVALIAGWDTGGRPHRRSSIAVVVAIAAVYGWAVVYLGAHWVSDVLVGWALGIAVGAASVVVARWVVDEVTRRRPRPGAVSG
ncbi:MAG: phosphatase PAP2 family protein [Acidimicrobiales bacterium]